STQSRRGGSGGRASRPARSLRSRCPSGTSHPDPIGRRFQTEGCDRAVGAGGGQSWTGSACLFLSPSSSKRLLALYHIPRTGQGFRLTCKRASEFVPAHGAWKSESTRKSASRHDKEV